MPRFEELLPDLKDILAEDPLYLEGAIDTAETSMFSTRIRLQLVLS